MLLAALAVLPGCSIKRLAVNKVGDALSSGTSTFETDEDIELVGDALPFSLKLVESLLAESPRHHDLQLTACRGFVSYAYGYVQQPADMVADDDIDRARAMRLRARKLYLRAFDHGMRAIELQHPGFRDELARSPQAAAALIVPKRRSEVVADLYWSAAALGLAISASKNDAGMLARIPEVEALLERAIDLDEAWDRGRLHEFEVVLAGTKLGDPDEAAIETHYARALELSGGNSAALYLARAESLLLPKQDRAAFKEMLERALSVDPDAVPDSRLANLMAQRRARWLAGRLDELFFEEAPASGVNP